METKKYNHLFKILIMLSMILYSCNTPERKIIDSFDFQRKSITHNVRAESAEVYDTLYYSEVYEKLQILQGRIDELETNIQKIDCNKDSIIEYKRDLDYLIHQELFIQRIMFECNDTICGYYTKIVTNKNVLNFVVSPEFRIICPVFILE